MQAYALWSMWTTAPEPIEEAPAAAPDEREVARMSAQDLSLPLYFDGQLW